LSATVFTPFERAWQGTIGRMQRGFRRFTGWIGNMMRSALGPIVALLGVRALTNALRGAFTRALSAVRAYDDSLAMVRRSLETVGAVDVDGSTQRIADLGQHLRRTIGTAVTDTNEAFSQLLTRGFDDEQATRLTQLAANMAKATGRPIADVVRQISDAADGSVSGLRRLGVQIDATGDRAADGEQAMKMLWAQFGDVGNDLVNPSEQLAAAWDQVYLVLGEKIAPIIEPLIQHVADFVEGLASSEEGQRALEGVANAFGAVVEWVGMAMSRVTNFVGMVRSGGGVLVAFIKRTLNDLLAWVVETLVEKLPGGRRLMSALGFDPDTASAGFREFSEAAQRELDEGLNAFGASRDRWLKDERSSIGDWVSSIAEAGREAREDSLAELGRGQEEARQMSFQREQMRQQQEERAATGGGRRSMTGMGSPGGGDRLSLRIVSTRADRFRRTRFAS
jgi:hypothetical protein